MIDAPLAGVLMALHALAAVLWVGGMGFALVVLRPSLGVLEPAQRIAVHAQVFRRFFAIVWVLMPVLLGSGYALLFGVFGGFATAYWTVHAMQGLGVVMAVVFVVIWFGPWQKMRRAASLKTSAEAANRIRKLIHVNLVLGVLTVLLAGYGHFN